VNIESERLGNKTPRGTNKNKHQIILSHSSRNAESFLLSFKYRWNGSFDRQPNYFIKKDGSIIKLLDDFDYSGYIKDVNIAKNSIIICLENLGWLEKKSLKNYYVNWIGDIYNKKPFERKWRDYYFWDNYTDEQLDSLAFVCKNLFSSMGVEENIIGHNTKIIGAEKYKGVICKSNFDSDYTDLSPAFDFDKFSKKINNE
jgi:hypothetical protein